MGIHALAQQSLQTLLFAIETMHTASFTLEFLVEAITLSFGSLLRDEVER